MQRLRHRARLRALSLGPRPLDDPPAARARSRARLHRGRRPRNSCRVGRVAAATHAVLVFRVPRCTCRLRPRVPPHADPLVSP